MLPQIRRARDLLQQSHGSLPVAARHVARPARRASPPPLRARRASRTRRPASVSSSRAGGVESVHRRVRELPGRGVLARALAEARRRTRDVEDIIGDLEQQAQALPERGGTPAGARPSAPASSAPSSTAAPISAPVLARWMRSRRPASGAAPGGLQVLDLPADHAPRADRLGHQPARLGAAAPRSPRPRGSRRAPRTPR